MGIVTIGVDVGQKRDPTAIVVVEGDGWPALMQVRHVERLTLGTPYPAVARRVAEVVGKLRTYVPGVRPVLAVDSTGVGAPVVDILRGALAGQSCRLIAATFTHGDRADLGPDDEARIGKAYLVSLLQSLLQTSRVKLPRTAEAEALARELLDFEIKIDQDANDTYGAFKVGTHDDLVTALGLACWAIEQVGPSAPVPEGVHGGSRWRESAPEDGDDVPRWRSPWRRIR